MVLATKRLILAPWEEHYAEALYELARDPRVGPVAGWPVHTSVENSRQVIKEILSKEGTFAVILKSGADQSAVPLGEPRLIGSAGFVFGEDSTLNLPMGEAELGYWLGVDYWGQGLITEAVEELLRFGFEMLELSQIWCGYFDGNERSRRVQEKCGFIYHHTEQEFYWELLDEVRTEHVTRLTREQWEERQRNIDKV